MIRKLVLAAAEGPAASGGEGIGAFLLDKLVLLLHLLENTAGLAAEKLVQFYSFLVVKLDEVFPPEIRSEVLRPRVLLPVALALFCLYCCCCRRRCGLCCCCRRGRCRDGRMMAAPGRNGLRMPRRVFEDDPRGYFVNLRGHDDLVY